MTQKTLETAGSDTIKSAQARSLSAAIKHHCSAETASFHTPGHKARLEELPLSAKIDLTELPGLDDLSSPSGPIRALETDAANAWGAGASFISINGASSCIVASILSCSKQNGKFLLPRDCHRSAVHALILSGLEPIWYDASWDEEWNVWSHIDQKSFISLLERHSAELAGALAISVNYSGAHSNVSEIARNCRERDIPLIVDEAHGAHLFENSALSRGAEIVVHSLHKTLGALTQTGLLHLHPDFAEPNRIDHLRSALNLVHSSSPSYVLMSSIESVVARTETTKATIGRVTALAVELRQWLECNGALVFGRSDNTDALHILFRLPDLSSSDLMEALRSQGIFAETTLGNGVLLLLGQGTTVDDINKTKEAIKAIVRRSRGKMTPGAHTKPMFEEQAISPRLAWSSRSELVEIDRAAGRIASDCIAPCPPGTPVLCPGQRIPSAIPTMLPEHRWLRVVIES